jgi:hypothetical protein
MKLITFGRVHAEFEESLRAVLHHANSSERLWLEASEGALRKFLASWHGQGHFLCDLLEFVPDITSTRLLLSVRVSSAIGSWCRQQLPHAEWGCCISETVAVEYAPDGYRLVTQLHEALHLLGVDECYDPASLGPKDTCSLATCLMRYGVQSTEVCRNVYAQLRAFDG